MGRVRNSGLRKCAMGFALPAVLITSALMMTVLVTAGQATVVTRNSLDSQYYERIARTAAESGIAVAEACLEEGTVWDSPLYPNTDCAGGSSCTNTEGCFVSQEGNIRTTFEVETLDGGINDSQTIRVVGTVERLRTSTGAVWRTYTSSENVVRQVSPESLSWKQVSAGRFNACGIGSDNWIYCWGSRAEGRLGDGTDSPSTQSTPVAVSRGAVPDGVTFLSVSVGSQHACAIASDNWVYCWGGGEYSQIGNGGTASQSTPVAISRGAIPAGATIHNISAGGTHTCAIASNNRAYCWGSGHIGRLGNGSHADQSTPVAVSQGDIPSSAIIRSISAGGVHTCAIASDNQAYCWGNGAAGGLGNGGTASQSTPVAVSQGDIPSSATIHSIATGGHHTCAIASNSQAYCWGRGVEGRLGNGSHADQTTPVAVSQGELPAGGTIRDISLSVVHTCAIASDNQAYCWGNGAAGGLGNGGTASQSTPVAVSQGDIPSGATIRQIAAHLTMNSPSGSTVTGPACVIASDNHMYCWGQGTNGRLGNGSIANRTTPTAVAHVAYSGDLTFNRVSAGSMHTCAVGSDHWAYCWGAGSSGQRGDSSFTTSQTTPIPVSQGQLPHGVTFREVSASSRGAFTCALASDSWIYCWGDNAHGQLGNGTTMSRTGAPYPVAQGELPGDAVFTSVDTGTDHTCATASNGQAYCWGNGEHHKLGNGDTNTQNTPVRVSQGHVLPAGLIFHSISAGDMHTCAVISTNSFPELATCWGNGANGRLARGGTSSQSIIAPISSGQIPGGGLVRQVTAGLNHTCAIAALDGQAYCWGSGGNGRLGTGNSTQRTTPFAVSQGQFPSDVSLLTIDIGQTHTCATASNNQAYCWGLGGNGRLGNNATVQQASPVAVSQGEIGANTTPFSISTGGSHTCTIASNHQAYCWGFGGGGRLGTGATSQQTSPVAVNLLPMTPRRPSAVIHF